MSKNFSMPTDYQRAADYLENLLKLKTIEEWKEKLSPKIPARCDPDSPEKEKMEIDPGYSKQAFENRWEQIPTSPEIRNKIADPQSEVDLPLYSRNIENYIGTVKVPVGIVGPLRVNGLFAQGDYYVPLATTEAALVASYARGSRLIREAGGCTALLLNEGISRSPGFVFENLIQIGEFAAWARKNIENFKIEAEKTTAHGKLIDGKITIEGNHVFLNFEFSTGDASGQNMATLAANAIYQYILKKTPVKPTAHFLEANFSGDKKASALSFLSVRGKKVTAEAVLPANLVQRHLNTSPEQMAAYYRISSAGSVLSGAMGIQGHYANALAAFYIATGQDAACVSESSVGLSRFEITKKGDLYASATLPNLMVGSIGGGTGLPSQNACLKLLKLPINDSSRAAAEICAALCLAGELSIIGALSSGDFSRAHELLSRRKKKKIKES